MRKPMLRVGVWGRDGSPIGRDGRLADDGKRFQCNGRFRFARKPSYRVGVWGREDSRILTDVEAGGLDQNHMYIYIYMILELFGGPKKEQPGLTLEREARSMGDTIVH